MRIILKTRRILRRGPGGIMAALVAGGTLFLVPSFVRADPVDNLKQTLLKRENDLANYRKLVGRGLPPPDKVASGRGQILNYWRKTLQKRVDELRTIGDLWGGLGLKDWEDFAKTYEDSTSTYLGVREMDSDFRRQIAERLTRALEGVVEHGGANSRLAVANSISERGPTYRSLSTVKDNQVFLGDPAGFVRTLTPLVVKLTRDKDVGVQQEALRALGTLFPKPAEAVPVFQKALISNAVGPKRRAAEGLGQLIRVANYLAKPGRPAYEPIAGPKDVLATVEAVVRVNSSGLADADREVRAECFKNIQEAARAIGDEIFPIPLKELAPAGRKLTLLEQPEFLERSQALKAFIKALVPSFTALRQQGPALARGIRDPDLWVRLAAVGALESIGNSRTRLKNQGLDNAAEDDVRALLSTTDPLQTFIRENLASIAALLRDPDARVRQKTVEFLDVSEEAAASALPLLVQSLNDPDRFIRWAAARAIYAIVPEHATEAVQALARLLSDTDLNVRMAAANTLREIGPAARAAVPALAIAVVNGDPVARIAAMEALQSMGPAAGKTPVPQLVQALRNSDARVRRAAAKTLGVLGPFAFSAIDALRPLIGDDDAGVRLAVGDAIMAIEQREKY